MTVTISHITIDCHSAFELSEWWKTVLGYTDMPDDPNAAGDEECVIMDPDSGHKLLFVAVPHENLPAKRIHFDVRPQARSRDEEVLWLRSCGAELVADHRGIYGPGSGWVTLADPEGNYLCVLRSMAEVEAQSS